MLAWHLSTRETEGGGFGVQGLPGSHVEFKANLSSLAKPYLKRSKGQKVKMRSIGFLPPMAPSILRVKLNPDLLNAPSCFTPTPLPPTPSACSPHLARLNDHRFLQLAIRTDTSVGSPCFSVSQSHHAPDLVYLCPVYLWISGAMVLPRDVKQGCLF